MIPLVLMAVAASALVTTTHVIDSNRCRALDRPKCPRESNARLRGRRDTCRDRHRTPGHGALPRAG